jgi:hypothetical protein
MGEEDGCVVVLEREFIERKVRRGRAWRNSGDKRGESVSEGRGNVQSQR